MPGTAKVLGSNPAKTFFFQTGNVSFQKNVGLLFVYFCFADLVAKS